MHEMLVVTVLSSIYAGGLYALQSVKAHRQHFNPLNFEDQTPAVRPRNYLVGIYPSAKFHCNRLLHNIIIIMYYGFVLFYCINAKTCRFIAK